MSAQEDEEPQALGFVFHSHAANTWIESNGKIYLAKRTELAQNKRKTKSGKYYPTRYSWGCPVYFTPSNLKEQDFHWKDRETQGSKDYTTLTATKVSIVTQQLPELPPLQGTVMGVSKRAAWKTTIKTKASITGGSYEIDVPTKCFQEDLPHPGAVISFKVQGTDQGFLNAYEIIWVAEDDKPDTKQGLLMQRTLKGFHSAEETSISIFIGELDKDAESEDSLVPYLSSLWRIGCLESTQKERKFASTFR